MNRSLFIPLLLASGLGCSQKEKNGNYTDVPLRLEHICKIEAVPGDRKADTTLLYRTSEDSIHFSTQLIANCCGWFNDLRMKDTGDTIRIVNTSNETEIVACDCNCLFEIQLSIPFDFYEKTEKPIIFYHGKVLNRGHESLK